MKSLDRIIYRIGADLRDENFTRFRKSDCVAAFNEAIETIAPMLIGTREDILANLDNDGQPVVLTVPAAGSDGVSWVELPSSSSRILLVEMLVGTSWTQINQRKSVPGYPGIRSPASTAAPIDQMSYDVVGHNWLTLTPGFTAQLAGKLRVKYESEIPPLLMGVVAGKTANAFILPETVVEADGQLPCEVEDGIYKGMGVRIYSGTGSIKSYKALSYTGADRKLTMTADFNPALVDADSKFAMMTPFRKALAPVDTLATIRACITLVGTRRNEDASSFVARYNELEENLKSKLESMTSQVGEVLPVDYLEDAYYR